MTRARWLRLFALIAGLALLWTVVIGVWLPRFAKPRIEAAASEALGAPLRVGGLEIAPWSLRVSATEVVLGPPGAAWLNLARLDAALSIESIWRLAPVLRRVDVQAPQLRLERFDRGRFNITPMLDALARRPAAPPDSAPARFAVHNIRVEDGRIDFFDRVAGVEHHVEALRIGVPFVSNLPSQLAVDVEPLLDAQVDGSRLRLQGKTLPFQQGLRSSFDIEWERLDLARWTRALEPLMPEPWPFDVTAGESAGALKLAFERREAGAPPVLRITGGLHVDKLRSALPPFATQLAWERLEVEGLDLAPFERRAGVAAVRLQSPEAQIDLAALLRREPTADRPAAPSSPATAATAPAWQWQVGEVDVAGARVLALHPAWPQGEALAPIALNLKGLDSRPDAQAAALALQMQDARGGSVEVKGTLAVARGVAAVVAQAKDLSLPEWLAPWQASLPVRLIEARANLKAQVEASASAWAVREADLALVGVKLLPSQAPRGRAAKADAPGDRLSIGRVELTGLEASSGAGAGEGAGTDAARSLRARSLVIEALDLEATRRSDASLAWLPAALPMPTPAPAPASVVAQPPRDSTVAALRWQLGELRCTACAATLIDASVQPATRLAVARGELSLRGLSDDLRQTVAFGFAAQAGSGGRVKLAGSARPAPLQLASRVDVTALDLRLLAPYLRPFVNLELASAKLAAAGELRLEGSPAAPVNLAQWRGRAALSEVRALDSLNQAELLRLKALQVDAADVTWRADAPLQADLGTVSLQEFDGRVIVNADGRLNLLDVARREGQEGPRSLTTPARSAAPSPEPPTPTPVASASAPAAEATGRPRVRWRSIQLTGGAVDFTDNFIRPNYSARLTDLAGSVGALAWNDPQPAPVRLAGKVDGGAPLEVTGSVHPLGARLATDIAASVQGIDITRLTGYSGRYAGYGIEKGTLSVKLRYKVEGGKLEAENQLYLDQLTFGDKVDSPDALKLPVLLAVSLLKDRNGVIDLNLPISGSLDDPKFSIGGVIVKVIVNLIAKAVTAPFSLLANAFGGGGSQELGHVDFAAGSAELADATRQRLDVLAKALNDRPALRLEATGHADPARDEAALRQQHVQRLLRAAKARSTGDLPDSVTVDAAERPRWIEAAYKAADLKDKPRNALGLAKGLPPAEMEALLAKSATIDEAALRALANERGDRVKSYLVTRVAPQRVLLTASKLGAPPASEDAAVPGGSSVVFALK